MPDSGYSSTKWRPLAWPRPLHTNTDAALSSADRFIEVKRRLRLMISRLIGLALGLIPLAWLDRFRSPPALEAASLSTAMLRLAQYRQIDHAVEIFSPKDHPDLKFRNCRSINYYSVADRRIYWLGIEGWNLQSKHWQHCCTQANRVLELGANIGGLTVIGAKAAPNTPYIAVEPHPVSAEILRRNLELNCLTNVQVIKSAVVGKVESNSAMLMVRSSDPGDTPTGAYLAVAHREGRERTARDMVEVSLVEATDLMDQVDLVKVDVEGLEFEILSSVEEIIALNRPTMFVEVLEKSPQLRNLLLSWRDNYGYRVYVPDRTNLHEVPIHAMESENFQSFQRAHRTRDVILIAE